MSSRSPDAGEVDDLVERGVDLRLRHPVKTGDQADVVPSGQLCIVSAGERDERGHAGPDGDVALVRDQDARDQAQQRRLPRTVAPHDADLLTGSDVERDVPEGPELLRAYRSERAAEEQVAQTAVASTVAGQPHADVGHGDDRLRRAHPQISLSTCGSNRVKSLTPTASNTDLNTTENATECHAISCG